VRYINLLTYLLTYLLTSLNTMRHKYDMACPITYGGHNQYGERLAISNTENIKI